MALPIILVFFWRFCIMTMIFTYVRPSLGSQTNHLMTSHPEKMKELLNIRLGLLGAWFVLAFSAVLWSAQLPSPVSSDVSLSMFSEDRAREHVRFLTEAIGVRASARATHNASLYIISFLQTLPGVDLSVQMEGDITNVVAIRNGTRPRTEGAVMIAAHYDSVPTGPGAVDDCAGVGVIMEIASVLAHNDPLERPVILFLTAAEERGMLGSRLFALDHPWKDLPRVVMNLEGSGSAEKEFLIRSNSPWATQAYATAAPHPKAYSLAETLFATIRVGYTDAEVFNAMGIHALDMIYVNQRFLYHSQNDTMRHVAQGAIQHEGNNVLSLTRYFATQTLPALLPQVDPQMNSSDYPPLYSHSVYNSVLDSAIVWTSQSTAILLFIVSPLLSFFGGLCLCFVLTKPLESIKEFLSFSLSVMVLEALSTTYNCVLALLLGLVFSVGTHFIAVAWRDVRVWYYHNYIRIVLYTFSTLLAWVLLWMRSSRGELARNHEESSPGDGLDIHLASQREADSMDEDILGPIGSTSISSYPKLAMSRTMLRLRMGASLLALGFCWAAMWFDCGFAFIYFWISQCGILASLIQLSFLVSTLDGDNAFCCQSCKFSKSALVCVAADIVATLVPLVFALDQLMMLCQVFMYYLDVLGLTVGGAALVSVSVSSLMMILAPVLWGLGPHKSGMHLGSMTSFWMVMGGVAMSMIVCISIDLGKARHMEFPY